MGICSHCGQPAGWFKSVHAECETKHKEGYRQLTALAKALAEGNEPISKSGEIERIANDSLIPQDKMREALVEGWEAAVATSLADRLLSREEETRLMQYANHFHTTQADLDKNGAYTNLAMSGVLRDVIERKTPDRFQLSGPIPFNLQKGESLVWVFSNVRYNEEKTRRHYEGAIKGITLRVTKRITYRVGQYKGQPVDKASIVHVDTGLLGVTTKHIYFVGPQKSFRIPYDKIVSFIPYSDGFGVHRDASSARPQIFQTGHGWFVHSLVSELAEWQKEAS